MRPFPSVCALFRAALPLAPCHIAASCLCLALPIVARASSLQLTLDVSVQSEDGTPLSDVPVEASTPHVNKFGLTDASGTVHFVLDADDTDPQIVVRLYNGRGFELPPEEAVHAEQRFHQLQGEYSFASRQVVPIVPEQFAYSHTVVAGDAVSVSGRVIDGEGEPRTGSVGVVGTICGEDLGPGTLGAFEFGGVPRDEDVRLYFMSDEYRMYFCDIPASATHTNVSLGDLVFSTSPANATADIEMTNRDDFYDGADNDLGAWVTIISTDGMVVYCFSVNDLGHAAVFDRATPLGGPTLLPEAAYYVSPGIVGGPLSLGLLEAIQHGRQAALDAAGVPKITAVAGQTTALSFDARAARDAILSVAGDLMPQD